MKNSICRTKEKKDMPKRITFRPKTKEARDKFYELGGAKWINRILMGLVR